MKLNTFLKQFDKITDENERVEFLKKHLKRKYVPFVERNNAARRTVEATHVIDNRYVQNSQLLSMFKNLDFIELCTDVEFERIVNGEAVAADVYDELMSRGIVFGFIDLLSCDELDIWESTYSDCLNDLKDKMTSVPAIIDSTSNRIAAFYGVVDQWVNSAIDKLSEMSQES